MILVKLIVFLLTFASVACPAAASELPEGLAGICITEISGGTLVLEGRELRSGDVLTAEQAGKLDWEETLTVGYLPIFGDGVAAEETWSLRGKENKVPVAEDQALETYKNLPNTAKLKAHDPEGEALTFTVVRQPRRGTVEIGADGSFTYTPKKNKVGVDSFTYTAADVSGKTSREATVTVTILKPSDAARYTDTLGKDCRFTAEWMRHTGIFAGEKLGEEACFGPEKPVTQGEFLTMLVKTLDIPAEEVLRAEGYEDAPVWLQPYLAAAVRSGLTAGVETFAAGEVITGQQAARMLHNALDKPVFPELTQEPLTRAEASRVLYETAKLLEDRKIDTVV